jgi:urease accessory protein
MHTPMLTEVALLRLLQLASSTLPVGAYSYSEGLEFLIHEGKIKNAADLQVWLRQGLSYGAVQLEMTVMARVYGLAILPEAIHQIDQLQLWNQWLSATKEAAELQQQSWQMGGSLRRLFSQLEPESLLADWSTPCNFAIAYILAAAHWQIPPQTALLGYAQSWANNLIAAGIKLIPLGQTQGQQLLAQLHPDLMQACANSLRQPQLQTCGWGLALASIGHESQYSRLFRS